MVEPGEKSRGNRESYWREILNIDPLQDKEKSILNPLQSLFSITAYITTFPQKKFVWSRLEDNYFKNKFLFLFFVHFSPLVITGFTPFGFLSSKCEQFFLTLAPAKQFEIQFSGNPLQRTQTKIR